MSSAFAIICWKDKILLFLRDNIPTIPAPNCWTLPGGGIEKGETPKQALKRELIEEVSYVPKKLYYIGKVAKDNGGFTYLYYSFVENDEASKFKHGGQEGQNGYLIDCDLLLDTRRIQPLFPDLEVNWLIFGKIQLEHFDRLCHAEAEWG